MNISVVVFDLGRTLMEYKGMHLSWVSYYKDSFDYVNKKLSLGLTDSQIETSIEIFKNYNPRVKPREAEISPDTIFADITSGWNTDIPVKTIIDTFFESLHLEPVFYEDSIPTLKKLRELGYKTAVLTDVATGMPDEMHKNYVSPLLPYFDLYVSSLSCGYKKPNIKGLRDIAEYFYVEPECMMMVGDDLRDVQAAKNFGCKSVLITRNDSTMQDTEKAPSKNYGQDYTISGLEELLEDILQSE
ncbi:MAG: HAD family hydrolase [Treponema sp.]|nr:HAD family hydrolase [Treponema sp.]